MANSHLLSPNFHLFELVNENVYPTQVVLQQLHLLAQRLQVVRDFFHRPIVITSGYRSSAQNTRVGGQPNSYHLKGMAADIVIQGIDAREVQQALQHWSGGLGCYPNFTHVDIRPYKARW